MGLYNTSPVWLVSVMCLLYINITVSIILCYFSMRILFF